MSKKDLPETMTLVRDNIMAYKNPLAVSAKENAAWADDLNLPKTGDILFYTGGEYQLLPFLDSLMAVMDLVKPGGAAFSWMMNLRDLVHKLGPAPEKIFASVFAQDKERYFGINRKAAKILLNLGYDLAYDGANEIYSGALLHEMGFEDALGAYSRTVGDYLRRTQAKTVVCLSPHAAEVFKLVYPKYKDFPALTVKTFPEMVWAKRDQLPVCESDTVYALHDSCRMARELGVSQELRDILDAMQISYVEPERRGAWTTCCGGPIKMTYPDLSHKLGLGRVEELAATGATHAIVSCPFCLSALTLKKHKPFLMVEDFVEVVARGYGDA